jgi:drug/metabolite transporter (DMT)-like permease
MPRSTLLTACAGGVLDMLANLLYLLASRAGPLTLAVTLSSLYPASTVILAWMILGERLKRAQWLGVACALLAIVMIVSV